MKHFMFFLSVANVIALSSGARADEDLAGPRQDLTPVSLAFQKLPAELGDSYLRIAVHVKNVGDLAVRASRGGIQIGALLNPQAALYGPNGAGGHTLGAPIRPGQTGMFITYASPQTLRHCQKMRVAIDTAQTIQSGPSLIFYNDARALTPVDSNSIRVCVGGVHP